MPSDSDEKEKDAAAAEEETSEEEKDDHQDDADEADSGKESKDDKPAETLEQKKSRLERQLESVNRKLGNKKEAPAPTDTAKPKSTDLDYAQLAFATSKGIDTDSEEEMGLVKDYMKNTGKDLKAVLASQFFKNDLKELREAAATKAAIPKGNKRSGQAASDTVDYYLAKGEMPPADKPELRRQYVDRKAGITPGKTKGGAQFYNSKK
ncbi:hypothetical protein [Dongia sp.]|uniref:hypothetical protein n=1 Tax=Dongia sp. TaxID=1977262 RepID=UPI0037521A57